MDAGTRDLLRSLLQGERVLSLAVLVDGAPVAGLLPFVPAAGYTALLIQASGLARHGKGLREGAPFGALIHAPVTADADPLQIPRLTVEGKVEALAPEGPEADEARAAYLDRFPTAAATMGLGDFAFYRLCIESGRLVAGFGRSFNLSASSLRELA